MTYAVRILSLLAIAAPVVAAPEKLAADAVLVREADLPEGFRLVEGVHCASPQAWSFYQAPEVAGFLPKPTRKLCQPMASDRGAWGSVFIFEYADGVPDMVEPYLTGFLWGEGGRSAKHPEEVIAQDRFVWILSFPAGDPVAEWYKDRLRRKFGVFAPRDRADVAELTTKVLAAYEAGEADTAIRLLREDPGVLENYAYGQYLLGDLLASKRDFVGAENAYRRAFFLHKSYEDPLAPGRLWGALDGLGHVLLESGKSPGARAMLREAVEAARRTSDPLKNAARSQYYLACACARAGSFDEAYDALKTAIALDPKYKKWARGSEHLAWVLRRQEFQDLVAE